MINSTFGGFMTARLGMSVSQQALNVTGQNITNVGTNGYTRQRLDQVSLNVYGGSKYSSKNLINIGNGVMATGTSQIRDQFLDRRFRNEMADVGKYNIHTNGLQEVAEILDETLLVNDKGGIHNQLGDFWSKLNQLSSHVGDKEYDTMVRVSADSLCKLFNSYAKKLETVQNNIEQDFSTMDVGKVNEILQKIKDLNKSIKISQIHGDKALELQDERNLLLDELSTYVKIEVRYDPVQVTDTLSVDELKIYLPDLENNGQKYELLNDDECRQFVAEKAGDKWNLGLTAAAEDQWGQTVETDVTDALTTGSFSASLQLLNSTDKGGIQYYQRMLDKLAVQFATEMNKANKIDDQHKNPLFTSDGTDTDNITASNIQIAEDWANNEYGITASKENPDVEGANDNILHMMALMKESLEYKEQVPDGQGGMQDKVIFKGTFQEFFSDIGVTLGMEIKSGEATLKNHMTLAGDISDSRDNVSGVSLDEEGMNMMQFSKAYQASARLMTVLDDMLNTLINGMGV